jgi:hypothetical protein
MPLPIPETPVRPTEIQPPCPGCPDPDNAKRTDRPCPGPDRIEDPGSVLTSEITLQQLTHALGAPACADILVCPRTGGSRIAPGK